jgi:hypothetical protein
VALVFVRLVFHRLHRSEELYQHRDEHEASAVGAGHDKRPRGESSLTSFARIGQGDAGHQPARLVGYAQRLPAGR